MHLANEMDVRMALAGVPLDDFESGLDDKGLNLSRLIDEQLLPQAESFIQHYCHRSFGTQTSTQYFVGNGTNVLSTDLYPIQEVSRCVIKITPAAQWYTFTRIRNINCIDSEGIQVATPASITDMENADLYVSCTDGILTIPPTIMGLLPTAVVQYPTWDYTWIRTADNVPNIEISLVWGYTDMTLPDSIRSAAAALVALLLLPQIDATATAGLKSWRIGDETRTWGGATMTLVKDPMFAPFAYSGIYSPVAAGLLATVATTLSRYRRVIL